MKLALHSSGASFPGSFSILRHARGEGERREVELFAAARAPVALLQDLWRDRATGAPSHAAAAATTPLRTDEIARQLAKVNFSASYFHNRTGRKQIRRTRARSERETAFEVAT